jgi:uncharacterized repeat protein (TIGR03843 family)
LGESEVDAPSNSNLSVLENGEIILKGKFLWGSNYTFLTEVEYEGQVIQAVYKPSRGERPLWDFPTASLAHREAAAYLVSEALELHMVPETIYRRRAPVGPGSLQRFIEHNPEYHYFNFNEADHQRLRPIALFDLVINNADRKGGHILFDESDHIWLIDHGICFHIEDKLRTVIWDFAGEPIPQDLKATLEKLLYLLQPSQEPVLASAASVDPKANTLPLVTRLRKHLSAGEVKALTARTRQLLEKGRFPNPDSDRRPYPWPPL